MRTLETAKMPSLRDKLFKETQVVMLKANKEKKIKVESKKLGKKK